MISETGLIPLFADKDAEAENDVQGQTVGKRKA